MDGEVLLFSDMQIPYPDIQYQPTKKCTGFSVNLYHQKAMHVMYAKSKSIIDKSNKLN